MAEPVPVRGWAAWRAPAGRVALGLLLVQALWRGAYLVRGYYVQDDFRMLELGGSSGLSFDYLFQDYAGHMWPGDFVLAWLTARVDPMSWTLTAIGLLVLQAAGGAMAWLVLSRLLGEAWARVPVLALFLFAPLTLWSLQWYSQAISFLPVTFFLMAAVWALLRHLQDRWRAGPAVVVAMTVGALSFQERGLLVPLVVGGVALVMREDRRPLARVHGALRGLWRLWAAEAAVLVGYLLLHGRLAPVEATSPTASETGLRGLATDFVLRTLVPGLVGGPWQARIAGETLVAPSWAVVVAALVVVAFVAVTSRLGGSSARWAWVMLAAYVASDVAILFGGRTRFDVPFGLIPRYVADVVPVATLAVAAALRGLVPVDRAWSSKRVARIAGAPAVVAGVVTAAYVGSAAVSTTLMAPTQLHREARSYVETLRSQLRANPRVVVYDRYVPDSVMVAAFGEERRVSTVLARAPENPVFDIPSSNLRIPDDRGRLRPILLSFGTEMVPATGNPDCGYPATAQGVRIRLREPVTRDRDVLRIGYYTNLRATMTVRTGEQEQPVAVRPGLNTVDLVVRGGFASVSMSLDVSPGTVCVTDVFAGFPVAATSTSPAEGS